MHKHRIVIEPSRENANYWNDLWNFRGLFFFLAWRDVLVRYKQTTIGVLWSILKPLLTIFAMCMIGWLFNSDVPNGIPRIILVAAATLPWQFFSTTFTEASNSLITNSNLLSKVYFPRMIVPVSTIIVGLIDFIISIGIIVIIMFYYQFLPGWQIVYLPLFMLLLCLNVMGAGLFIAALNVKYRDFRYIIPFIVQFGLYVSPIAFSSNHVLNNNNISAGLKYLYCLNPLVGIIDGFRWSILGEQAGLNMTTIFSSVIITLLMLIFGIAYFRKTEKSFADII